MGDEKGGFPKLQQVEEWANAVYLSILKSPGSYGVVCAVIVGVLIPLVVLSKKKVKQRGFPVEVGGEAGLTVRNGKFKELVEVPWEGATTVVALFEQACKRYEHKQFLGTRKVISKDVITANDGRKFEKLHLGEYQWETYGEAFDRACNFASGLVKFGHEADSRAAIFSETRAEWIIALQGCLRQNITVVTIYASLGEDALIHSLNETQVSTLICDLKQLKKVGAVSSRLESLKRVIYFEEDGTASDSIISSSMNSLKVASLGEVEKLGKDNPPHPRVPSKDDIAVIMYTSGSTGLPKGVLMTHGSIVATAAAVTTVVPELGKKDVYLAYLPLAHVLELEAETVMLASGAAIGYGSTLTLTDTSNKIKKGTKGDASVLKPTLMVAVPAILDRVRDGVMKKVEEKGGSAKMLFNIAYKRRLAAIEGSWFGAWGLEKLVWDFILFCRIQSVLGGHIRFMLCGGAPLSGDTQRFINICMGAPIGQGYGLTETCAGAAFSEWDDTTVGRVGPPLPCCYIKPSLIQIHGNYLLPIESPFSIPPEAIGRTKQLISCKAFHWLPWVTHSRVIRIHCVLCEAEMENFGHLFFTLLLQKACCQLLLVWLGHRERWFGNAVCLVGSKAGAVKIVAKELGTDSAGTDQGHKKHGLKKRTWKSGADCCVFWSGVEEKNLELKDVFAENHHLDGFVLALEENKHEFRLVLRGYFLKWLVSWEAGGYTTSDQPMPRGEVVVGGCSVTLGYFNNEEKTKEVYKVDERGMRWFYTGDIGQFHPDGCLEIIDRKKDIVKLQHGEYISLGKVEAALMSSSYVDNIMVYADPFHHYCVALVVPSHQVLEKWAQGAGIEYNSFSELCDKAEAVKEVQDSLSKAAKEAKLDKFEIPGKIKLLPEPWTPESGLVTAALKLKREQLKAKFKNELQNLYE
ncbi:hypothetical protein Ancab_010777 [Ancistrocladus abbreviatus]